MDRLIPNQRRLAFAGGFDDAFARGPYRAEGSHVRAVPAPEHDDDGIQLVQVVVNY